jgi:BlaI family transcriptional regulator, penicillinase repressor
MPKRAACSKAELEIARIVWDLGGATVRQVHESLPGERRLDYKTVQTYLRRLEEKGYLRSRRDGKTSVYTPRVRPAQVIRETIDDLVERLFGGEALPLVEQLIADRALSRQDLERLRQLIDDAEAPGHALGKR